MSDEQEKVRLSHIATVLQAIARILDELSPEERRRVWRAVTFLFESELES